MLQTNPDSQLASCPPPFHRPPHPGPTGGNKKISRRLKVCFWNSGNKHVNVLWWHNRSCYNFSVHTSQVPRLTWKSVGWTNPPGAGKKTLEPHNSKIFMGDHQKLMLIGKLHSWRGYWCWCHSLIFIGCPARSGFRSPPVCNLGHLPFATSLYCCNHLYFFGFSSIFAWHFFPHYCTKHLQWKKTVQAGEVGGPLQFLGEGADRAAWRREKALAIISQL